MELPTDEDLRQLIGRQAALRAGLHEEFGQRPLVLPDGRFFPDRFERSRAGVSQLLARMQQHAGLADIPIEVLVEGDSATGSSCSSGSCSPVPTNDEPRLMLEDDTWRLRLAPVELGHPVVLTTLLARSLSTVFLEETRPDGGSIAEPIAITTDLAAVELGLGILLLEGSHIYQKSCGGPSIARLTALGTAQLAVSTALFAAHRGHDLGKALGAASATQKAALGLARRWAKANKHVAKALGHNPRSLTQGDYRLKEPSAGLFGFLAPRQNVEDELEQALLLDGTAPVSTQPAKAAQPKSAEDEELAALVESSLAELRGG